MGSIKKELSHYEVVLFSKAKHNTIDFTCGVSVLDLYLKQYSTQESKKNVSTTYVLTKQGSSEVLGFYTLSSYSIVMQDLQENEIKKLPRYPSVPAILIGRLAIAKKIQRQGLGEFLLVNALKRAYDLSKKIGLYAVVVEAKNQDIVSFYRQYGFYSSQKKDLRLYLPIKAIEGLSKI